MNNKLLSIIIPTYNMENFLPKCLNSLIIPEIDYLDIIIVNDGSKDKSSEIAQLYSKKYPLSIKVIDKENGNYGSCINKALPLIKGKYVKILDADDSFETSNLSAFLKTLKKIDVDLVISNYEKISENGDVITILATDVIPANHILKIDEILKLKFEYLIAMHAYTYNSKIFNQFNYKQTEGISYTDTEWHTIPVIKCKTLYYFDKIIYKYLVGREGQTIQNNILIKKSDDLIKVAKNLIQTYQQVKSELEPTYQKYYKERLFDFLKIIYPIIILGSNNSKKNKDLIELDNHLKNSYCSDIHDRLLTEITISPFKFKYIDMWEKNKKNNNYLPLIIIKKLILIKNKLLKNE